MERDDEIEKISKELEDILRMTSEKKRSSGETETEKKNLIPSENGTDEKEESTAIDPENISVLTVRVSVTATGSRDLCQQLIDDLYLNYPSLRITGYSFVGEGEDNTMNLNLDYYMKAVGDFPQAGE